ncbi:MAG: CRISPR-associated helicase Cas3' [Lactobacillus sp.]|nr:CRISPR-associated helicase Cas3' [Lactobacillus sp.]MCI1974253.1 CRISPR-associated helicase Cas3' [Lactobacillus sp.]
MNNLSPQAKALWGKKSVENGQELWLPLVQHLLDTKNVINWLFNHWLSDGERQTMYQDLSNKELQPLVKFLGFIHDFGKATPAFQLKKSYINSDDLDHELIEKLALHGFQDIDECLLSNPSKSPHPVAGEALLESYGVNQSIGAIIGGHHGIPQSHSYSPVQQLSNNSSNYFQKDKDQQIQTVWKSVQNEIFEYGLEVVGYERAEDIPAVSQTTAVILEGLLIMADWLASTEYLENGQPLFPLISLDKGLEDIDAEARFENGISAWTENNDAWAHNSVLSVDGYYQKRWNFSPRPVQGKMSEQIGKTIDPGMIIIEAPMGIGKTEIALTAAEQLADKKGENGLFMGLPTQATTDAMFNRVNKWLSEVAQENDEVLDIKLMHSKAQFNPEYVHLPHATDINDDSNGVAVNSWFSGKKSILNNFTVGTIDNLLLIGLKQRHLFLKHLAFSGKVVIIDEIHAYDAYVSSYLRKALEWLGAYHVPVVALSATLPVAKRNELLSAYAKGRFGKRKLSGESDWKNNISYPLLTILDGDKVVQADDYPITKDDLKTVQIKRLNADEDQIIGKACSLIDHGGVAGVIVNTVKEAQKLASLVPDDIPCLLLHSAFLATDRSELEQELQKLIGKNGKRTHQLIIIGTQVLEQSLDIDFDVLLTEIAPMDLLIQRIGRLHRHHINRPEKLKQSTVYLLGAETFGEYSDADEAIYGRYLLTKTDHFLNNVIQLPVDIPKLVQAVYSPETDGDVKDIDQAAIEFRDELKQLQQKAKVFQIKPPKPKKTLLGWLDRAQSGIDKDDIRAQAAVRDIKETIEVVLLQKKADGFYLLDGSKYSENSTKRVAQQLIRLPSGTTPNIARCINELESQTQKYFANWENDVWLRGSLAFVLDENCTKSFNGWCFTYSKQLGLAYEKEGQNE